MIGVRNITFAYDGGPVIKGLSLPVGNGSWLGLIGPNGAGKTTLIRLISGLLTPTAGTMGEKGIIELNGRPIKSYTRREMARLLAVVPQFSPFAFAFSALEIVLMGRFPYLKHFGFETKADLEITREAMIKTGTLQFRDRPIDELSGGERQRVLVARALAQGPEILLLDEPTAFLDIKHQIDIMEMLADLNKEKGLTIVSAIHDINLAISYCSEIALIHNGKIYKHGTPTDVITYANLKDIFGAEIYVGVNELTKKPYYIPMRREPTSS